MTAAGATGAGATAAAGTGAGTTGAAGAATVGTAGGAVAGRTGAGWATAAGLAGALVLAGSVYISNFALTSALGTGSGIHLYYIAAAALTVLFLGVERVILPAVVVAVGAAMFVIAQLQLPFRTDLVPPATLIANFVVSAGVTVAILFGVVFYAFRQIARAEAALEREYARSETLLANILPPAIASRLKQGRETVIADSYDDASILFATWRASPRAPPTRSR